MKYKVRPVPPYTDLYQLEVFLNQLHNQGLNLVCFTPEGYGVFRVDEPWKTKTNIGSPRDGDWVGE